MREEENFDLCENMAASVMLSSVTLKPADFTVEKMSARGLPSLTRASPSSFKIVASGGKKIKTDKPFGPYKHNTVLHILHSTVTVKSISYSVKSIFVCRS